ncbi:mediator complex subunit 13 C-terminal-domain-containing protein [Cercophora scortea]|uniref:Mediator of RNA polymerase II transcription subunit 13 n=1 Tax=Cercophora scortea TaxID=314031 RepID=A0AAE0IVG1_9PEZI|nr:mediator complex subunit 13 C-terminal-domain-containing protein [Cercophora scortea]
MDAGEYDTNTLLINNLSAVSYRIYEPVASHSSTYTFAASIVEDALRSDGHLVYMDAVRRGIWCFYLSGKDAASSGHPEQCGLTQRMEVCGYFLGLVEEGSFEPVSLLRNHPSGTNPITTPSSSSSTGSAILDVSVRGAQSFGLPSGATSSSGAIITDANIPPIPLQEPKGYASVPVREKHEFFINAVLSSLSTSICHQIGAISLNHRTILLPPQAFHPDDGNSGQALRTSALATFRVYLTTTGSLIISLCVSLLQGLVSSADLLRSNLLLGSPVVLAAPLGAFGALQGIVDADLHMLDNNFGQSPDTQMGRLKPDPTDRFSQWKSTCSKLLQMRGMSPSLLDSCSWLNIHFLQRKPYEQRADGKRTPLLNPAPTAPWPSVLCFRKPKFDAILEKRLPSAPFTEHSDPINYAKTWCQGQTEREETITKRKREKEAALSREAINGDVKNQQLHGYSPLALRRTSHGAAGTAAGAMYPTPPDGVQVIGVTPSFDTAVTSPANQPPVAIAVDINTSMHHDTHMGDGFSGAWDGTDPKREHHTTGFLEGDNMFGDLGEDMFEGNELTEADFNFFDEQPGGEMGLPELPDMEAAMNISANLSHSANASFNAAVKADEEKRSKISALPEFTKPELKHARSTLGEEARQLNSEAYDFNSSMGIKRHRSPFTPDTVFKRVRASIHRPPQTTPSQKSIPPRRGSVFERVDFDPSLSLANKKYQESGPFNYTIPALKDKDKNLLGMGSPLSTGALLAAPRHRGSLKELPSNIGLLLAKISRGPENSPAGRDDADAYSNSDETSWASDQDDTSDTTGEPSSPAKSSVVRRRPDDDTISMAASFKDLENASADSPAYGSIDLSRLSVPEIPELSITKYFADPEPVPLRISCSDEDYITVAQILTEQAASGSLRFVSQSPYLESREVRRSFVNAIRYTVEGLQRALPRSLASAAETQLRPLIEVQDILSPGARVHPKELVKPSIFLIPAPHLDLRRYETQLSVLPSAVLFWEALGLGPSKGAKDIVSVCAFPHMEGIQDNVVAFLDRICSAYETLKLGSFSRLPTTSNGISDGLLPFSSDQDMVSPGRSLGRTGSGLSEQMATLGQALAASSLTEKNFVVYCVYSSENPASAVECCASFRELFEHYKRAMVDRKKTISNDLVLQLVPLDYFVSPSSIAIPTPSEYAKLCFETYDRCTLFGGAMPAPAIVLEQALPKVIDFELINDPSPNLLQEHSCMHIAYAQSVDERWISAAWTDNRGSKQMTASYCLGRRGGQITTQIADVAHEIWETTHDLIPLAQSKWRVIITKCGPMDDQEADLWISLAHPYRERVALILMTVDTNPSLQLIPPAPKIPVTAPSVFAITPVSTPQASIVSPEQSGGNPPTPIGATSGVGGAASATTPVGEPNGATEPEADVALVDITDTTWAVLVAHRLNNSTSLTELNPAIASGYLVKRGGTRIEDAPVAMEVNMIHDSQPRMYDSHFREMLGNFRGLGTLARARGVVDRETDVRPWHVAAAEKAVRALYQLM